MIADFDPVILEEAARWLLRALFNQQSVRHRYQLRGDGALEVVIGEGWQS